MANGNAISITGGITRDPETRDVGSTTVTNLGVAVNRRFQRNGEWEEETSFFDVTAWGDLGTNTAASVRNGTRVSVSGYLKQETWEKDGDKRSKVVIVADDIAVSMRFNPVEIPANSGASSNGAPAMANAGATDGDPWQIVR